MAISIGRLPDSEAPRSVDPGRAAARSETFDRFYREYVPRVAGYVRRHIHDPELIDDVVQETLMRAYRHGLHHETGEDRWRWLSTVARNLCIDQRALHRNWRERRFEAERHERRVDLTTPDVDPETYAVFAEHRDGLLRALAGLTERERRLLVQKHVEGRGVKEMAHLEGIHVEALKSALRRARRAFAESYASVADRHGLPSVFGPVLTGLTIRMRTWKARVSVTAQEAAALAVRVATPSIANPAVTAAVVLGLGFGATVGGLDLGDERVVGREAGELTNGALVPLAARSASADSHLGADAGTPSFDSSRSVTDAWRATSPSRTPGGDAPDAAEPRPTSSMTPLPGSSDAGGATPPDPDPVDVGSDDVDEPEDAWFKDIVAAPAPGGAPPSSSGTSGTDSSSESGREGDATNPPEARQAASTPEVFAIGVADDGRGTRKDCVQCTVLFRSADGGATWVKLAAIGLDGDRLLLPPDYPRDPRIFAVGRLGIQVSTDGGRTFDVLPGSLPGGVGPSYSPSTAFLWPGFGGGEGRMVAARGTAAWVYNTTNGATRLLPMVGTRSILGVSPIIDSDGEESVLVATQYSGSEYAAAFVCRVTCERRFDFRSTYFVNTLAAGALGRTGLLWAPTSETFFRVEGGTLVRADDIPRPPPGEEWDRIAAVSEGPDGTLYANVVAWGVPDQWLEKRSVILTSGDGGSHWSVQSIAPRNTRVDSFVVLADGRMIGAAWYGWSGAASHQNGLLCSEDGGKTWLRRCVVRTVSD